MSQLRKILRNFVGMSMVEVLLASAMAAGLGLVVAKISQQSQRVNRTAESNIEMLSITQDIAYILSDKDSCIETVAGPVGANIDSIKKVKSGAVSEVYRADQTQLYGNKTFFIDS